MDLLWFTRGFAVLRMGSLRCSGKPGKKSDLGRSVRKIETNIHHSIDNLLDRVA